MSKSTDKIKNIREMIKIKHEYEKKLRDNAIKYINKRKKFLTKEYSDNFKLVEYPCTFSVPSKCKTLSREQTYIITYSPKNNIFNDIIYLARVSITDFKYYTIKLNYKPQI